jgi:hypothetical protein
LYWSQGDRPEYTGAYSASFSRPDERVQLVSTDANALYAQGEDGRGYLLWLRGGTLVAQEFDLGTLKLVGGLHTLADPVSKVGLLGQMNVAVSTNGLLLYSASTTFSQFTWFDRWGKSLGTLGEPGEYNTFRLSPNGRRAAATRVRPGGADLWEFDVERGVAERLTYNSTENNYPVWSPDGQAIVFTSCCPRSLFRMDVTGSGSEQRVSQPQHQQLANDWSRDGKLILFYDVAPATQRDLWTLSVSSDGRAAVAAQPKLYLRTPFNESFGRFSPEANPRWVAYQSDVSGRYEVYVQAFPGPGDRTPISTGGGTYPQWSSDGHELFYVSPDNKLMAVKLQLGRNSVVPSAPSELFALPVTQIGWSPYDTAPDGRFLVRATPKQVAQPLTVIVNWPALLKKEGDSNRR